MLQSNACEEQRNQLEKEMKKLEKASREIANKMKKKKRKKENRKKKTIFIISSVLLFSYSFSTSTMCFYVPSIPGVESHLKI